MTNGSNVAELYVAKIQFAIWTNTIQYIYIYIYVQRIAPQTLLQLYFNNRLVFLCKLDNPQSENLTSRNIFCQCAEICVSRYLSSKIKSTFYTAVGGESEFLQFRTDIK